MKAVILAAGRGSRMGELTAHRPKCLLPVAGKALLDWQIEALREAGLGQIGVVRGFLGETLELRPLRFFENPRWKETNMLRSLIAAEEWLLSDTCLVSYGDILYSAEAVRALVRSPSDIAIAYDVDWLRLWRARFRDPLTDAETFRRNENGLLSEIGGRPKRLEEIEGQYMGLLKFTPEGWARVQDFVRRQNPERVDRMDMTALLRRLLAEGVPVHTAAVRGGWFEIDREEDLKLCEKWISQSECIH